MYNNIWSKPLHEHNKPMISWFEIIFFTFLLLMFLDNGIPSLYIAVNRARKASSLQYTRALGSALKTYADSSPDRRYPATYNGTDVARTSTEAFNYQYTKKILVDKAYVYAITDDKKAPSHTALSDLCADNVCLNYMVSHVNGVYGGVHLDADDNLPLLWSSGNEPLIVKNGASELKLLKTGVWNASGATVYYKGNNASFKRANSGSKVNNFIPAAFVTKGDTFNELAP